MGYPKVVVDTKIITENVKCIIEKTKDRNISIAGVTKGYCAYPEIAKAFVEGGVDYLADSRLQNLKKLKDIAVPKIMLILPIISESEEVVIYSDISLNSEVKSIKELEKDAE